ncbi:unnamed protein product [Mytilus edulis]|uniref:DNA-directed DNA polymerase n=1 Tax=Mytilus edulis TaxID=6550 RepID=A0A8S3QPR3_MYTED|nr:unnamed protein product [Mytilus edulis]
MNTKDNQNAILQGLPDMKYYNPDGMKPDKRREFMEWYNEHKSLGLLDWCKTEEDRQKYTEDYFEKEGIRLDAKNINCNPGLRQLAKLMLNSFWGKFGQRLNLPRTTYLTDPSIYFDILTSDSQEVQDVSFVTDDMVRINWINQSQFIEETGRTNVVIAAYTTTQARLQLYKYLENLGDRALYCDTDSIIFSSKPGDWRPITGDYLGDLTDETPNNNIDVFVSGGPKNYGYKLKNPDRDGNRTCCKIRGITLNYKNALELNFDTMKDVVQGKTDKITVTDDNKICREVKTTNIITRAEDKTYRIVFDKRVLKKDYTTTPYGM